MQSRLGYKKLRGPRHLDNDDQMRFVHELRSSITGRGKKRTWAQVMTLYNDRYNEEVSETTLKARYATWIRLNGFDK